MNDPYICYECIDEAYLKDNVKLQGTQNTCSYCGKALPSISIEALAEKVELAFDQHYCQSSNTPEYWQEIRMNDSGQFYNFSPLGDPAEDAIANAAGIPPDAAAEIQKILYDKHYDMDVAATDGALPFDGESYYHESKVDSEVLEREWNIFEKTIKSEVRFFSPSAYSFLSSIFSGISTLKTNAGSPVIVKAGPNQTIEGLYRARVFQNQKKLINELKNPIKNIGTPPSASASSGRMNAKGIPVFYGAMDSATAIAEVRPPVDSKVVVARFIITRPISLLDLTAITDVLEEGSIFDPTFAEKLKKAHFLRSLSKRMTAPVMPDDAESEYLITQCIADFLATCCEVPLDGIIFPSHQTPSGKENVVLFNKAASIKDYVGFNHNVYVNYTSYQMDTEDLDLLNQLVYEITVSTQDEADFENGSHTTTQELFDHKGLHSKTHTLKLDITSISIHTIKSVIYNTFSSDVKIRKVHPHDDLPF